MRTEPVEWLMMFVTLPPCYVSKFLVKANGGWTGTLVSVLVRKGDIALNLGRAMSMWLATILIDMPSSTAQHTICAPFFLMPVAFAPLTLRG